LLLSRKGYDEDKHGKTLFFQAFFFVLLAKKKKSQPSLLENKESFVLFVKWFDHKILLIFKDKT